MNQYTMFPLTKPNLWSQYKNLVASFWTPEEVDLTKDMNGWEKLGDDERHFLKMILAFFAGSDGIVYRNVNINFSEDVEWNEAKAFYSYQGFNEMIHSETYSLLIEKYISDLSEKETLFNAIEYIPCVKRKAEWALKWFDKETIPFEQRLLAFACVEGIHFSGSFCAIFWLKHRGVDMPGLFFSNELISRDEGLHLNFALELFTECRGQTKVTPQIAHKIIKDAVAIEKEFITDAIPCKLIGMDSEKMGQYIEYVADRILKQLGYQPVWDAENPFDFMETLGLEGKTNFFEKRVGEYTKHMDASSVTFDEEF